MGRMLEAAVRLLALQLLYLGPMQDIVEQAAQGIAQDIAQDTVQLVVGCPLAQDLAH